MEREDVVIVGAGHGGAACAIALRQQGFEGSITLVGDEAEPPYERPPLSKHYLAREKPFERILIRPVDFWRQRAIALRPSTRIVSIDPGLHRISAADGSTLEYGKLVWSGGGRSRRLTCGGADLAGVHSVRALADVDRLMGELPDMWDVVVAGGGYIGLEAAAVLTKLGKRVVVLEAQDRLLARVAGEPLSRFFEAEHRAHGVDVRLSTSIECIEGAGGRVLSVRLASGEYVAADAVIVGIGIVPEVDPLIEAGARWWERRRRRRLVPHRPAGRLRHRRLRGPRGRLRRGAAAEARVGAEPERPGCADGGRDRRSRSPRLFGDALVLVPPVRSEAADRRPLDRLRRGRDPWRRGHALLLRRLRAERRRGGARLRQRDEGLCAWAAGRGARGLPGGGLGRAAEVPLRETMERWSDA